VPGRFAEPRRACWRPWRSGERGNALVETALVVPLLLLPAFGVVATGRVVQAQMGVSALVREAARSASLADSPADAANAAFTRAQAVATGYGLTNGSLRLAVDPGSLARGAQVRAAATYDVGFDDVPLISGARFRVASDHVERVDVYRSRWAAGGAP
jgi:Flp pilus assembly protein TadG